MIAFRGFKRERYSVKLSDGSILGIQALSYGETNTLIQGSGLERAWARWSPWLGIKVPGFTLPLPTTNYVSEYGPNLAFLLHLKHPSKTNLLLDHDLRTRAKVILFTEKGAEYSGFLTEFSTHGDSHYAHCSTHAFPRQKRFWIRLELMEGGDRWKRQPGIWKEVARFYVRNPCNSKGSRWTPEVLPLTKQAGPLEVTLGEMVLAPRPANFSWQLPDPILTYWLQVKVAGQILTNWAAQEARLSEGTGNYIPYSSVPLSVTNGWRRYAVRSRLDPKEVWKLQAQLARDSGFDSNELFRIQLPHPSGVIKTNLDNEPVRIECSGRGADRGRIEVSLESKPTGKRLTFVKATDAGGESIHEHGANWEQHRFSRAIRTPRTGETIQLTIAIHTNIPVEFTFQPSWAVGQERGRRKSQGAPE